LHPFAVTSAAGLATIATAVSFLGPIVPRALADSTATTASSTTTTAVPGSNCSAVLNGKALDRTGWVASSNASSEKADSPANALDGNYSTRFSSDELQVPGLYFEVNMGSLQSVNELDMSVPNSPNDYAKGFDVQVSKDGSTWATVAVCTSTGTREVVSFPGQNAQYVKVVLTANDPKDWWSIDELNLLGTPPPPTTTTTTVAPTTTTTVAPTTTTTVVPGSNCSAVLNGVVLAQTGWVASTNAPSKGADVPANAIDGNFSTRFSTDEPQAPGLYFEVNLGSAESFDELRLSVPGSSSDYARAFNVQVSSDGSSWATVASCTGGATPEVVGFSNQTDRYLRVVLTTADSNWWSIDELDLLGTPPPPNTTTTTSVPPTTTTTVPPFKFRGYRCRASWPRYLVRGTLVVARHKFFVVQRPCLVLPVLGTRVLVAYDLYRHGRERILFRWSPIFRLGSPMHRRVVELWVGGNDWLRWNGRLDRVPYLGSIG
jgi:hypothetical protein